MLDAKAAKLLDYINKEISKVTAFDETDGKKAAQAKLDSAHKKGYLDALTAVQVMINENMQY